LFSEIWQFEEKFPFEQFKEARLADEGIKPGSTDLPECLSKEPSSYKYFKTGVGT